MSKNFFLIFVLGCLFDLNQVFAQKVDDDIIKIKNGPTIYGGLDSIRRDSVFFRVNGKIPVSYPISQIEEFNNSQFSLGTKARPKFIVTSHHEVGEEKLRAWSELVSEIIYTPLDRPYLLKRFVTLLPEIQPRLEAIDILSVSTNEIIRVANPIALTTISEAILTMKYYRTISFHSFRRFCLPSKEGEEKIELLGSCFFSEKKKDHFVNHFVFFGITDKHLKYIRKWILERYISSKDGNSSGSAA